MAITVITSADAGVPALTNAAGSLIALYDYLLVTRLGWTKPFSGANKAAYKQPAGTNGFYLRVEDTTTNYLAPLVRGYETMTDVDTGTGAFPSLAQVANLWHNKGAGTSGSYWYFVSNGKMFHLYVNESNGTASGATLNTSGTQGTLYTFGDIVSEIPGDPYSTILVANQSQTTGTGTGGLALTSGWVATSPAYTTGSFIARSWTRAGGAKPIVKFTDTHMGGSSSYIGAGNIPQFPDPSTNSLRMGRIYVAEQGAMRGHVPGLWSQHHTINTNFVASGLSSNQPYTIQGTGELAGRVFLWIYNGNWIVMLEISDTWD